jgi:hypothetical protein
MVTYFINGESKLRGTVVMEIRLVLHFPISEKPKAVGNCLIK